MTDDLAIDDPAGDFADTDDAERALEEEVSSDSDEALDGPEPEPEGDGPRHKPGKRERAEIRARREAEERTAALERENAFLRAGVPEADEHPGAGFFREHYSGDATPEAVREAYLALGIGQPKVSDAELDEHEAVAQAAAGGAPGGFGGYGSDEYRAEVAKAETPAQWREVMDKYGVPVADGD